HGIDIRTITLHCGVASLERGERPQPEWFSVPGETVDAVSNAKRNGRRVVASGTSVVRALESAAPSGELAATSGWTDLIVTREQPPRVVDALLSGLHQPDASHVDLLRGLASDPFLETAYAVAAGAGLRWHEFGDLHLIK
ncbi:MAG: S-adenosylmethionine:tRNA ribosyltransferase-isomerase, partial [Candidatus Eremiobacteraeota bacterium]|nr:S-adenosylmethionine:tRNA ribosyltransferase-isomerase [Candidatus Eremiobacteraeota bacterium]